MAHGLDPTRSSRPWTFTPAHAMVAGLPVTAAHNARALASAHSAAGAASTSQAIPTESPATKARARFLLQWQGFCLQRQRSC